MLILKKTTIKKVLSNKKHLESKLKVKIFLDGDQLILEGQEIDKFEAEKVIDALNKNFALEIALLLLQSDYIIENIPIKNLTRKTRKVADIKSRIIGTHGKALRLMAELSGCYITLHDNEVSIIGTFDNIKETENAVKSLIYGLKHAKVYGYLEKTRTKIKPQDLGLKR